MSSTNVNQILGGLGDVLRAMVLKSSIERLAMTGLRGESHGSTLTCLKLTLKSKEGAFEEETLEGHYVANGEWSPVW